MAKPEVRSAARATPLQHTLRGGALHAGALLLLQPGNADTRLSWLFARSRIAPPTNEDLRRRPP